jgi:hypothetical protein
MGNLINLISSPLSSFHILLSSKIHGTTFHIVLVCTSAPTQRIPYMSKGTFSIIVNQTEAKTKTPSTDSQLLIPGFPASKLRAEKIILSSYGLKLSNGKGKKREGHQKHISLQRRIPRH